MKDAFIRIAERSIEAADAALNAGVQEKSAFLSYHAFESSGSALGTHFGLEMGKNVSHPAKLRRFVHAAKKIRIEYQVTLLSIKLTSMRNKFLYPEILPGKRIVKPENQITDVASRKLLREVKHVVSVIKSNL